mmetsp:Transcript_21578/g.41944  ORF Transcript_21578/g.41944 Transcript_21578/m.41944 type:complete len:265 (+) Transcript_21578:499-1293(+)
MALLHPYQAVCTPPHAHQRRRGRMRWRSRPRSRSAAACLGLTTRGNHRPLSRPATCPRASTARFPPSGACWPRAPRSTARRSWTSTSRGGTISKPKTRPYARKFAARTRHRPLSWLCSSSTWARMRARPRPTRRRWCRAARRRIRSGQTPCFGAEQPRTRDSRATPASTSVPTIRRRSPPAAPPPRHASPPPPCRPSPPECSSPPAPRHTRPPTQTMTSLKQQRSRKWGRGGGGSRGTGPRRSTASSSRASSPSDPMIRGPSPR